MHAIFFLVHFAVIYSYSDYMLAMIYSYCIHGCVKEHYFMLAKGKAGKHSTKVPNVMRHWYH